MRSGLYARAAAGFPSARRPGSLWGGRALWAACLALTLLSRANGGPMTGEPEGQILAAGDRRVMILSSQGEIVWEYPTELTHDAWMLPDGHILFADGATVTEVSRERKVVFQYRAAVQQGGGTYACQRLADGRTLIGENSTGRVLEVDAEGKELFRLQTTPYREGNHHNLRMVRKLGNGNYLVCHSGAGVVKEYSPKGETVWQVKPAGNLAFAAARAESGTTYVTSLDQIEEFDASGRKVWGCSTKELEGGPVRNLTGFHLLPNGDVAMGCYQAYQEGAGCGLLLVTRDKRVKWRYSRPGADHTQMAVQLLSADGAALPGPCLR